MFASEARHNNIHVFYYGIWLSRLFWPRPILTRRQALSATDRTSFLCEESVLLQPLSSLLPWMRAVSHSVIFLAWIEWKILLSVKQMKITSCRDSFKNLRFALRTFTVARANDDASSGRIVKHSGYKVNLLLPVIVWKKWNIICPIIIVDDNRGSADCII